jgi:hypothetical protein
MLTKMLQRRGAGNIHPLTVAALSGSVTQVQPSAEITWDCKCVAKLTEPDTWQVTHRCQAHEGGD